MKRASSGGWDREKLLIGGEWVPARGGAYSITNPATAGVVGVAPAGIAEDAYDAAAAAREAFGAWSRAAPEERCRLLERVADILARREHELVSLVQAETGATQRTAAIQVPSCIRQFKHYARTALESQQIPALPHHAASTAFESGALLGRVVNRVPVGVVACIASYDSPLVNMARKVGPALAKGNTVIMKPAPQDPLAVIDLAAVLQEAGFPPGVVSVVTGPTEEVGAALVDTSDVDMISFTGSARVGALVVEAGAATMKRNFIECGGKGSALVFDDADLDAVVAGASASWTFYTGQHCTTPARVLVHRSIYGEVVERLAAAARALCVGDPLAPGTEVGPVISAAQRDRIERYVDGAVHQGATVVTGGTRPEIEGGYFVAPTLLADCTIDMTVAQEEVFGPVVVVVPFDHRDEVIALTNSTPVAHHDYVYTADTSRAFDVARRIRSGNVSLNMTERRRAAALPPFEPADVGCGASLAVDQYTEMQSVSWSC